MVSYGIPQLRQRQLFDQFGQLQDGQTVQAPLPEDTGEGSDSTTMGNASPVLQQIAQQSTPTPPTPPVKQPFTERAKAMYDAAKQIYTPSTTRFDALNELLQQAPQRNNPGKLMSVLGGITAFGKGSEEANKMMYAPYERAKEDWTTKVGPYEQSAAIENQQNSIERQLAGNVITSLDAQDRESDRAKEADERNRIAEKRVDDQHQIAIMRDNAATAKRNGATVEVNDATGEVVARYGGDHPHVEYLGKVPGSSTAAELANIRGGYQVEAAKQANAGALQRAQITGTGNIMVNGKLHVPDPDNPGNYIPATGIPQGQVNRVGTPQPVVPPKPADIEEARQVQLRDISERYPGNQDLIRKDNQGKYYFVDKPKQGRWFDNSLNIKRWNTINKMIHPDYDIPPEEGSTSGSTVPATTPVGRGRATGAGPVGQQGATGLNPGEVMIQDVKTGKTFGIPRANLQKALDSKLYRQVQ